MSKLFNGLNPHKAHGHDGISLPMVKLCNFTITKPLSVIYKNCLKQGVFLYDWKKGNIILVHQKTKTKERPVSLLPTSSKIFEKLIFDSIYEFLDENNLFSSNQSGFIPNDSFIHQLTDITHNIFRAFDANPSLEVRGVFLDLLTLHITFSVFLILTLHWKLVVFSLIY